jgi:poly-beta-hydroxyalkanoate depolymerase
MAGPIDCRVNPTKVNKLANKRDIGCFDADSHHHARHDVSL